MTNPHSFYLAGPMTGIPQFNFPLFDSVAAELRDQGYEVHSPAEMDDESTRAAALASPDGAPGSGTANGETYGDFLSRDIKIVLDEVDGVCVLPGFAESSGACIETYTAMRRGKPVYAWDPEERRPVKVDQVVLAEQLAKALFRTLPPDEPKQEAPRGEKLSHVFRAVGVPGDEEVRQTSETGGQKGTKPVRLDLIPPEPLWMLSRVYGFGAEKYDDHNYLKGYPWSLSYAAMLRHLTQWWNGEDNDDESDLPHLAHAAWHCFALMMFQQHELGTDDRIAGVVAEGERIQKTGRSEEARR